MDFENGGRKKEMELTRQKNKQRPLSSHSQHTPRPEARIIRSAAINQTKNSLMKLVYFDIAGKAEAIRLCAAVGHVAMVGLALFHSRYFAVRPVCSL